MQRAGGRKKMYWRPGVVCPADSVPSVLRLHFNRCMNAGVGLTALPTRNLELRADQLPCVEVFHGVAVLMGTGSAEGADAIGSH